MRHYTGVCTPAVFPAEALARLLWHLKFCSSFSNGKAMCHDVRTACVKYPQCTVSAGSAFTS
uniref:Uncharacterized protein n=1 Tax=Anguilla anguilla TaxID=7936 RepID=A0A0E9RWJ3_ANGAN